MIDLEVLKIYTWGICTELNNNNYYKVAQHTEPTIPRKKFAVKNQKTNFLLYYQHWSTLDMSIMLLIHGLINILYIDLYTVQN